VALHPSCPCDFSDLYIEMAMSSWGTCHSRDEEEERDFSAFESRSIFIIHYTPKPCGSPCVLVFFQDNANELG